ncbi:MAG: S8 family peptidase [Eubacteriales bacterium]|nr:S8 family peptidase [Eubacteriales bacterium]
MNDQKIENLLNLALESTPRERQESLELDVGYDRADRTWDLIVRFNGDILALEDESLEVTPLYGQYAVVTIPESRIFELASRPEIEYIEKPKRLFFSVNQGKAASCVSAVQTARFDLFGQGTILAVIDSGADYRHPDFRNEDGTTRILDYWDQTVAGRPPEGYRIGTAFTRADLNALLGVEGAEEPPENSAFAAGLRPSVDVSGHGTQVLGIAAGNGRASDGIYQGMAPQSDILVVKLGTPRPDGFPRTAELIQAVDYVVKKAIAYGKPTAINLSFGNNYGSHNGTSLIETYLNDVSNLGRLTIAVGTGNEGSTASHTSGTLQAGRTTDVELGIAAYEPSLNVQIWKAYEDQFEISVVHPDGQVAGPFQERLGAQRFLVGNTNLLVYYGEPAPYSTAQEIYIDFLPVGEYIDSGVWKIRLTPKKLVDGRYDLWLPGGQVQSPATRFYEPTVEATLTIPSTARKVISVAAYDSRLMTYAPFSGRGYLEPGRVVKPDLAAPGVEILTTAAGGGYVRVSGTSFATPFVAGAGALLMQWGERVIILSS